MTAQTLHATTMIVAAGYPAFVLWAVFHLDSDDSLFTSRAHNLNTDSISTVQSRRGRPAPEDRLPPQTATPSSPHGSVQHWAQQPCARSSSIFYALQHLPPVLKFIWHSITLWVYVHRKPSSIYRVTSCADCLHQYSCMFWKSSVSDNSVACHR